MSAMDTELTEAQLAAARALARQAIKDGILEKLRDEWVKEIQSSTPYPEKPS